MADENQLDPMNPDRFQQRMLRAFSERVGFAPVVDVARDL